MGRRRGTWAVVVVVIVLAGAGVMLARSRHPASKSASPRREHARTSTRDNVDPRSLPRSSVTGTVADPTQKPIANARVCGRASDEDLPSSVIREPRCTSTDATGHFTLGDLVPAHYRIVASARSFRPAASASELLLAPGETKTGVDITLRPGGVEVTGTIYDATGGPIEKAHVSASSNDIEAPPVETDARGNYSLWCSPGEVFVQANAEGYVEAYELGVAPSTIDLVLAPESSLSGTVVDAITNEPVPGVKVEVHFDEHGIEASSNERDITDEAGRFHVKGLEPGRYIAVATSSRGYGRAPSSTRVGLAQNVEGIVVKLNPAFRIVGKVLKPDKTPCPDGHVRVSEPSERPVQWTRPGRDGVAELGGMLPGIYDVAVSCPGYVPREDFPPIKITDRDVEHLEWSVEAGATVSGRVLTKNKQAVVGARVEAKPDGRPDYGSTESVESASDGAFRIDGLAPGRYSLEVASEQGVAPAAGWSVTVSAGQIANQDLVLDEAGVLKGKVVDTSGTPAAGAMVLVFSEDERDTTAITRADGTFTLEGLPAGDYRVTALWALDDDSSAPSGPEPHVTIVAGSTKTVDLVVKTRGGSIQGIVLDAEKRPVSEAYVSAARESANGEGAARATRWSWNNKPVITTLDGTFKLTKLTSGTYTIRAEIKGGGEVIAEHVAVGGTATLQLKPTSTIRGQVKGASVDDFRLELTDSTTGFSRREHCFRTGGSFVLDGLPAGHFTLIAIGGHTRQQIAVDVAEGKTVDVTLTLEPMVSVTGRVVDAFTKQPIEGVWVRVVDEDGLSSVSLMNRKDTNTTGADGRFTLGNVPSGRVVLSGHKVERRSTGMQVIQAVLTVSPSGAEPLDVGDILAVHERVKEGQEVGELGLVFERAHPNGLEPYTLKVTAIDPGGPASNSGIRVGDVVTAIDGIELGAGIDGLMKGEQLMQAPPGTTLVLGLQRGATVSITLAQ